MKHRRNPFVVVLAIALAAACAGDPHGDEADHGASHGDLGHGAADAEHGQHEDEEAGRVSLSPEAYEAAAITLAPVALHVMAPAVRVTGTLSYDERRMAVATARIGGRIAEVLADYGARVAPGDVLAWIDSPELGAAQADYRRAASLTALRRAEHERARLLLEGDAISRGETLRREADWRAAEAELATAEQKLHLLGLSQPEVARLAREGEGAEHVYPVRAPIRGRVTERAAVAGRVVTPENELFTIAELDPLWLLLQVFEKDLHSVTEGAAVTLTCESHPEDRFGGTIDYIGQVLDPHSRTLEARASIENPDGRLRPGMFVYATIEPGEPAEGAEVRLAVPEGALAEIGGKSVVFVRAGEREFEVREVSLGESRGSWVEVRSGLAEGETIAVAGVFTLKSELAAGGLEGHHH
jgi:cobalt-zinc-cadmium efflux system membrane fusion protein